MTLTPTTVVVDTLDATALATWWARQTGGTVRDDFDGWFVLVVPPEAGGQVLAFQRVPDPTPGKNRLHVDFAAADRDAEVERLLGDGATFVARHEAGGFEWVVLEDPDGNQFCVTAA